MIEVFELKRDCNHFIQEKGSGKLEDDNNNDLWAGPFSRIKLAKWIFPPHKAKKARYFYFMSHCVTKKVLILFIKNLVNLQIYLNMKILFILRELA